MKCVKVMRMKAPFLLEFSAVFATLPVFGLFSGNFGAWNCWGKVGRGYGLIIFSFFFGFFWGDLCIFFYIKMT